MRDQRVSIVTNLWLPVLRCSLALSNTIKLRVDHATVDVQRIEYIPFQDEFGDVICDKDGEPLIHTHGKGFISGDLAILCAKHFTEAMGSKDDSYEFVDLLKLEEESLGMEATRTFISDPPLLVQCRILKDGYAVKGTLLGLNYGQMDDNATFVAMIGSVIPLDEVCKNEIPRTR